MVSAVRVRSKLCFWRTKLRFVPQKRLPFFSRKKVRSQPVQAQYKTAFCIPLKAGKGDTPLTPKPVALRLPEEEA